LVLNWFLQKVYWPEWIARQHRRRSSLLTRTGVGATFGLVALGFTALSFVELGWLPRHETPFRVPEWLGSWFEIDSVWETLAAQVLAAAFVVGRRRGR